MPARLLAVLARHGLEAMAYPCDAADLRAYSDRELVEYALSGSDSLQRLAVGSLLR